MLQGQTLSDKEIVVGINRFNLIMNRYPANVLEAVRLKIIHDPVSLLNSLRRRFMRSELEATEFLNCIHFHPGIVRADLLHLVNVLSLNWKPWVVTFEHYLPRWDKSSTFGIRLLAGNSCRKIIAMSEYALRTQESILAQFPREEAAIRNKMTVVYPAQETLTNSAREKRPADADLSVVLVGHEFFRKGGKEVLRVFERLISEGEHLSLTIVSSLATGDYASCSTDEDRREALATIERLGNHVQYHSIIPRDQVLEIFRRSDLALLPTYDDTFGFSVLEAQAAACPVITTRCCALPEINNSDCGWLIDVPVDELGTPLHDTVEQRAELSKAIEVGLYALLKNICRDPFVVRLKGAAALERIKTQHDPGIIAGKMENIYREALTGTIRQRSGLTKSSFFFGMNTRSPFYPSNTKRLFVGGDRNKDVR
ncbi:MAG: glycosyltransferase family 4 protein [Bacteroidota bacterium]